MGNYLHFRRACCIVVIIIIVITTTYFGVLQPERNGKVEKEREESKDGGMSEGGKVTVWIVLTYLCRSFVG